jgi:hypothetical protein
MISTDHHHGYESLAERQLLLALDFVGAKDVVSQPFRLRFSACDGWREHVPDFLVVLSGRWWLFDVRPGGRIAARDEACFAAAAEAALGKHSAGVR